MPLTDNAVVYPNTAHILHDPTGAAARPTLAALTTFVTNTATPPTGFLNLGHTAADNIFTPGSDGGDSSVKGSLQNQSLRQVVTSATVDYFDVVSLQVRDNQILTYYYGGGDVSVLNTFQVPDTPIIQTPTILVVILDDNGPLGMYVKKTGVKRADNMSFPADDFSQVPLRFTPLKVTGISKVQWIGAGLGSNT